MTAHPTSRSKERAHTPLPESADVIVVGAGLGGLTAAAYLARRGMRVVCVDAHYVAGGCATQFRRRTDHGFFHFDVGLHYIGDCGPGGQIPGVLAPLGIDIDMRPLDPDGFDTLVFPGLEFRVPVGLDRYRDRLVETFPKERSGIDRYVRFVREVGHMGGVSDAARGKAGFRVAVEAMLRGRLVARYQNATVADLLDSCTKDPMLRAVMLGQHGDYGLPPSQVSAVLHAGLAYHYFQGAFYPRGGGQIIADKIAEDFEAHGGTIHLRRTVERILTNNGRVTGVQIAASRRAPAQTVLAPIVLSNADIQRTFLELLGPEVLPADVVSKARDWQMGGAIFMTCVGVRGDLRELGMRNANYWAFDSVDVESFYREANTGSLKTHGAYITSASLKDEGTPGHAPDGFQSIEIMSVLPGNPKAWGVDDAEALNWSYKRTPEYEARKQQVELELLARLERLLPGVGERVVFSESATPVTQTRFTRATDGTGYGLAATPSQFLQSRPGYRGPLPGLYLCGASTRAGHGIVGAMRSGVHAANTVLRDRANVS